MRRSLLALCCAALCLAVLCGCSKSQTQQSDPISTASEPDEASSTPTGTPDPAAASSEPASETPPEPSATGSEPVETVTPTQTPEPTLEPTPEPTPTQGGSLDGQAVGESDPVEECWFEDAVFLGDSRTEGLQIYSGLRAGDFFWYRGMTVFRVDDPDYRVIEVNGEKMTLLEALAQKSYAKVYIMIGINELGYPASSYNTGLRQLVDRVKEIQPNAVIYLQTLPPVNEELAAANGLGSYINNTNVNAFNEIIVQVAKDKQVALLDVASAFRTAQGDLAEDMSSDGVHFYRKGYVLWYEYLKTHALASAACAAEQASPEPAETDQTNTTAAPWAAEGDREI